MSCCKPNHLGELIETKGFKFTPETVGYIVTNNGMEREGGIYYEKQSLWIAIRDSLEGQNFYQSIGVLREKAGEGVNKNYESFDIGIHVQKQALSQVMRDLEIKLHLRQYSQYLIYMEGMGEGREEIIGDKNKREIYLLQYTRGKEHHYNALIPMKKKKKVL